MKKCTLMLCLLVLLAGFGMFFACSKDGGGGTVLGPMDSKPAIAAYVTGSDSYSVPGQPTRVVASNLSIKVWTASDPILDSVGIQVDGGALIEYNNGDFSQGQGILYSSGVFLTDPFNGSHTVKFMTQLGNATAQFRIPPPLHSSSYKSTDTISPTEDVVLNWNQCADFYLVAITWNDTSFMGGSTIVDSLLTGTSFTMPATMIPANAVSLDIGIGAGNGPMPGPGQVGNIAGACDGFVLAFNGLDSANVSMELYLRGRGSPTSFSRTMAVRDSRGLDKIRMVERHFAAPGRLQH